MIKQLLKKPQKLKNYETLMLHGVLWVMFWDEVGRTKLYELPRIYRVLTYILRMS